MLGLPSRQDTSSHQGEKRSWRTNSGSNNNRRTNATRPAGTHRKSNKSIGVGQIFTQIDVREDLVEKIIAQKDIKEKTYEIAEVSKRQTIQFQYEPKEKVKENKEQRRTITVSTDTMGTFGLPTAVQYRNSIFYDVSGNNIQIIGFTIIYLHCGKLRKPLKISIAKNLG